MGSKFWFINLCRLCTCDILDVLERELISFAWENHRPGTKNTKGVARALVYFWHRVRANAEFLFALGVRVVTSFAALNMVIALEN